MTAEYDNRSTVNKRYEPPSEEVRAVFKEWVVMVSAHPAYAQGLLRWLDKQDEHMVRALMYHARNGGLA